MITTAPPGILLLNLESFSCLLSSGGYNLYCRFNLHESLETSLILISGKAQVIGDGNQLCKIQNNCVCLSASFSLWSPSFLFQMLCSLAGQESFSAMIKLTKLSAGRTVSIPTVRYKCLWRERNFYNI